VTKRSMFLTLLTPALLGCASAAGAGRSFQQLQVASIPAHNARILGLLTNGVGSLVVVGDEGDSLSVRYSVSADSRAGLFRNQVETIDKGDSVFVTIRPAQVVRVDLQVEMPEKLSVGLRDDQRQVVFRNVENRIDVFAHPGGGSLDFDDVEGSLTVKDGPGPIRIHDVRGPILIVDEGGGIRIDEVTNTVSIDARSGSLSIQRVGGDVNVTAGDGDLTIRDVTGRVSYKKTGRGKVTIEAIAGGVEKL
jgi:hypothetical protein